MRTTRWISLALLLASSTSFALPPNAAPGLRPGANHHTGDDGFVADLGREPKPGEEKTRMHEHFVAVRARLAGKPATRPDLESKRQQLLAALDTYIAQGVTPDNDALPWRTPVFIDDKGTICAVGYLIQESAGRALAEKVATGHRYSFIEDIAKDMPEVRAWVAESGFTLDELGQIQPGYQGPDVLQYRGFDLAKDADHPDGAYDEGGVTGVIVKRHMEGAWAHHAEDGTVIGAGNFHRGAGPWISLYPSGRKMAEGAFAHDRPSGAWRIYHESGNLAAEGHFARGIRTGAWKFYYDVKAPTPIAIGRFRADGYVDGTWKHFDDKGGLLATSTTDDVPARWEHPKEESLFWSSAYRLDITPTAAGITHRVHQGSISGDQHRLDELGTRDGAERVYLSYDASEWYDDGGHLLVQTDGGWRADDCKWSAARKRAARAGDLAALHGLLWAGTHGTSEDAQLDAAGTRSCTRGKLVPAARAARIGKLVHSMDEVRAASPQFIEKLTLGDREPAPDPAAPAAPGKPTELTDVLAANMALDIAWPHVDRRFIQVFRTLPGYRGY